MYHSLIILLKNCCGPGNLVGIATDYGLDGPRSNPSGDEIFRLSRPALGPTQVTRSFPGVKCGRGVLLTTHPFQCHGHGRVELYLYPPSGPHRTCNGIALPFINLCICGPGSSVVIATDYALDGPRSNPSGDDIFVPSRPALGPTQPPVQWVPSLSWG